jgi:hypothetical protein
MPKGVTYFLTLVALFGALYVISLFKEDKPAPLSDKAISPDMLLGNSRMYIKERNHKRGLVHLAMAIDAIRKIEADLDDDSKQLLEDAIFDLEKVYHEIEVDSLSIKDLNISYSEALNALTLAELKVSEALIDHGDDHDALVALQYGIVHLKNALKYTEGEKLEREIQIIQEIEDLIANKDMTREQKIEEMQRIEAELDSLLKDNLHRPTR